MFFIWLVSTLRKLNGCVSSGFLFVGPGFHVENCAKTRVSLHSQLHSNYVVFALLLYEKCRTVAEKKNHPTRGNLCNKSCANLFADWTFPRIAMHIHALISLGHEHTIYALHSGPKNVQEKVSCTGFEPLSEFYLTELRDDK